LALDVPRLIKLLGLLGSDAVGERAAAALKVVEWLSANQVTWEELLAPEVERVAVAVSVGGRPTAASGGPYRPSGGFGGSYGPQAPGGAPGAPGGSGVPGGWRGVAREILDNYSGVLRGTKERDFLEGRLRASFRDLTPKQEDWLRDIAGRVGLTW